MADDVRATPGAPRCITVSQRHSKQVLTRAGARCLLGSGRSSSALCALLLSAACAVDGLDRLGAGNAAIGAPDAGTGGSLEGPLRPDSLALDASNQTGPATPEPGSYALADAGNGDLPSASNELMPNPGFEEGHEGWFGLGSSRVVDVLDAPHGGSRAILSTNRAASWDGPAYDIRALVEPAQPYAVSVWVRNELDTQMVKLTLKSVCEGEATYTRLAMRVVATSWLQLTSGFFVPECPSALEELVVYVEGPPAFKNVLIDDVSLRAVTLSGEAEEVTDAGAGSSTSSNDTSSTGGPSASSNSTATASADDSTTSTSCTGNANAHATSNATTTSNASCNGNARE